MMFSHMTFFVIDVNLLSSHSSRRAVSRREQSAIGSSVHMLLRAFRTRLAVPSGAARWRDIFAAMAAARGPQS